jgi:hypothetical protein
MMGLTIMSHSSEVKPFFATVKVTAERAQRCSNLPYTGKSVSTHRKLLTTRVLHEASHPTRPVCSCDEEIFRRLIVEGFWNVVHLMINKGTSSSHLRLVPPVKPYESETPC